MIWLAEALVLLVALEHFGFAYLEMALWTKPQGRKIFGLNAEQAESSKVLAANQGLYNGFLAAGLMLFLALGNRQGVLYLLACVVVAGLYGAVTVKPRIALVQALPAAIAFLLFFLAA